MTCALGTVLGCGGPRLALPKDFNDGMDIYVADGRSGEADDGVEETIELGPYRISEVKRGLSTIKGFDAFDIAPKTGITFKFIGANEELLTGKCATPAGKTTKDIDGSFDTEEKTGLGCTCDKANKSVAYILVEDLAGEYGGPFVVGDVDARATGVYKLESGTRYKGSPVGFQVDDATGGVAAIEVLPGTAHVWIKKRVQEPSRGRIVCTMAGLMLWNPPVNEPEE